MWAAMPALSARAAAVRQIAWGLIGLLGYSFHRVLIGGLLGRLAGIT